MNRCYRIILIVSSMMYLPNNHIQRVVGFGYHILDQKSTDIYSAIYIRLQTMHKPRYIALSALVGADTSSFVIVIPLLVRYTWG